MLDNDTVVILLMTDSIKALFWRTSTLVACAGLWLEWGYTYQTL